MNDMLQRMNELAVKAKNGTETTKDRSFIDQEIQNLKSEIERVKDTTTFNEKELLKGGSMSSTGVNLQVGAESGQVINLKINSMGVSGLGLSAGSYKLNVKQESSAGKAISAIKSALETVSEQRASLGAVQNRLEHTIKNLDNVVENTTAAESQIRDTDMASEMVKFSNNNILAQAGQSMLAQANQSNQGVLSILG